MKSFRFAALLLILFAWFQGRGQTQRYLEIKTFSPITKSGAPSVNTLVIPTINKAGTRLAISTFKQETSSDYKQLKGSHSAKILNLLSGRLEFNEIGTNIHCAGNKLAGVDYSAIEGKWIDIQSYLKASLEVPRFTFDPQTNTREPMPAVPDGYTPITPYGPNSYTAKTTAQGKNLSVLLERHGDKYEIKYNFDVITPALSPDSTQFYGVDFNSKPPILRSYDVNTGKLLKSMRFPVEGLIYATLLKDGTWIALSMTIKNTVPQYTGSLVSADGSRILRNIPGYSVWHVLSEDEKETVFIKDDGTIKAINLATGDVEAELRDTYIKYDEKAGFFRGAKTVGVPMKTPHGFVLFPYSTGIMSLYSIKDRKVVADIFADLDDWAVIAKDGRVDGTAGAFEKLEWRDYDGDRLVARTSLESTFDKYYTPRLLYSIISGEPAGQNAALNMKQDAQNAPVLAIETINDQPVSSGPDFNSANKNIKVGVRVSARNERVKEIRMYGNGKLLGVLPENETGRYVFNVSLNSVYGGMNALYAIAGTADGIDSEKSKILVNYSGKEDAKPRMYVLVVGINKYLNPRYELNYALPDAEAVKTQLAASKSALFESVEVKTLFDDQATKAAIVKAFKDLSAVVKEQDMFFFYYAGHGAMNDSGEVQEFYIVPHDVTQMFGNDELLREKAISATEIKKLSLSINAQKQIFILDACQSAGALTSVATRGAAEERAIGQLARSTGTFWLTAAGSDQFATEFAQLGHGVFTYSLLEAMQGKDPRTAVDGTLTVRELSSYVEQRVPELSQKYKGKAQYPASFSFGNDFPILIVGTK